MSQHLFAAFAQSASNRSEKPALFWAREQFSYGQILQQSLWVGARLRTQLGVQPGDRVALWLRNRPEFVSALFGILAAGGVAVPINNFLKPNEMAYMLEDAGVKVVLTEDSNPEALAALQNLRPDLRILRVEDLVVDAGPVAFQPVDRSRSDLAVLIYTSGTTGKPKGAMLTHGNLLHNVESCRQILQIVDLDRLVLLLPMFHSFMLTVGILLPLLVGGSIVLIKSLTPPKAMIEEILINQGTVLPAMAQVFRALSGLPPGIELSLRLCVSGAGPLPMEILKGFNARHPKVPLIEGYGLSEASPVVSVNPIQGPWIPGTIGIPIPDVEMTVQDDSGALLADGVDGEICVRGGNVMAGYWNAPEKTAETLVGGWLRTGDIGHRRPDGYYVITDRKKDMLKPNGINVYPREIEEVLYGFQGIRECAVVGEPDERRGERVIAFAAMDEGRVFDEKAVIAFLKERLADYKVPRRVIPLPALPRNATGKILKTFLREMLRTDSAS
ncbi:MAG: long-chain fatty acid--CoA ligase [Verrucomicrobia bacterium]|nr:long-chain fatty acid--CoA ligase [Verrucomicrobiota bacterium]